MDANKITDDPEDYDRAHVQAKINGFPVAMGFESQEQFVRNSVCKKYQSLEQFVGMKIMWKGSKNEIPKSNCYR
ncbi:hypothetical protein ACOME3_009377 [Neoechinorhynchus agilis]